MQGEPPTKQLNTPNVLLVIAGIYITQSIVGGLTFQGIPTVMRNTGASLDYIGLVSLLMLPWALKFLWAGYVERLRIRPDGRRLSRPIILVGQVAAIILIAGLALMSPSEMAWAMLVILAVTALITSTVDISCDAFTIEQLRPTNRPLGNIAQVGGGYTGMIIGSGLFLIVVDATNWQTATMTICAVMVIMTLPMTFTREPQAFSPQDDNTRPSLRASFNRPAVRWGLTIVLLSQIGIRVSQGMISPFLVDQGYGLSTIGWVYGGAGTAISIAGTVIAGLIGRQLGAERCLPWALAIQAAIFFGFVLASITSPWPAEAMIPLLFAKSFITGAGFVLLYTAMMNWSSPKQAGVDFTLLQCADAGIAALAGLGGGILSENFGYSACFGLAAFFAAAAVILLPSMLTRVVASPEAARSRPQTAT